MLSVGYSPYRRIRRKHRNPELLVVTSAANPQRPRRAPSFQVMTGKEPFKVIDLSTGGEAYFQNKVDAYRHMAVLKQIGRTYRLESRESRNPGWERYLDEESPDEATYGPRVWLRGSSPSAVSGETPATRRGRTPMKRRKKKSSGKKFIRMGGKRVSWKGLSRRYGPNKAGKIWRKKKKFVVGGKRRKGGKRRRKGSRKRICYYRKGRRRRK